MVVVNEVPAVSVVVPCYNAERYLEITLTSILAQDGAVIEIIAVNDGSTDGTQAILDRYSEHIRVIVKSNAGVSAARNAGAAAARGQFLCFCDADDVMLPGAMHDLLTATDPSGLVVVYGDDLYINEVGLVTGRGGSRHPTNDPLRDACLGTLFTTGACIVSSKLFHLVGGFDDSLHYSEDWDYTFRLARRASFHMIDRPVIQYRVHSQSVTRNYAQMLETALEVLRRHVGEAMLWPKYAPSILVSRLKIGYYFSEEHRKAKKSGSLEAVRRGRKSMWRHPWLLAVMVLVPVLKPIKHFLRRKRIAEARAIK